MLSSHCRNFSGTDKRVLSAQLELTAPPLISPKAKLKFWGFSIQKTFFFFYREKANGLIAPPPLFFRKIAERGGAVNSNCADFVSVTL